MDVPQLLQDNADRHLTIQMNGRPEIPQDVLMSLRNSGKSMIVNYENYSVEIDGSTLGPNVDNFDILNVNMTMEYQQSLSNAFDNLDVMQLHFIHKGQLPGPLHFKIKAAGKSPGDIMYVYYLYEQADVIEAKQKVVVDSEGYITVTIYHCSSYIVTDEIIAQAMNNPVGEHPETQMLLSSEVKNNDPSTSIQEIVDQPIEAGVAPLVMNGSNITLTLPVLIIIIVAAAGISALFSFLYFRRQSTIGTDAFN